MARAHHAHLTQHSAAGQIHIYQYVGPDPVACLLEPGYFEDRFVARLISLYDRIYVGVDTLVVTERVGGVVRVRRIESVVQGPEVSTTPAPAPLPKRKRGRPRKHPVAGAATVTVDTSPAAFATTADV